MAKFKEHDWVEIIDGNDKGRRGFITKRWNEAGVDLYEVYFRDGKGRGSTYGIAERALKPTTPNSAPSRSSNPVVQNAINARTARNEGVGKLKVTMQTITFQGRKSETRILTLAKLEELMKALGHSDLIQSVLQSLTTRGSADFDVDAVEVDVLAL